MATATAAEANTQLANAIKPYTDLIAQFPTIVTSIDAAQQDLEGDTLPGAVIGQLAELRARLNASNSRAAHRAIWNAWAIERMRTAGLPYRNTADNGDVWPRMARILHEGSETFNDRNLTVAATGSAGGSNVGDGTLSVLREDWEAYPVQRAQTETLTWECSQDQNLGRTKYAEAFELRGEDASKDALDETGSGRLLRGVPVQHSGGAGDGRSYGQNMSFDAAFSGSGTDKIPGWTIGTTAGDVTATTANVRNGAPGVATSRGLQIAAGSDEITQALSVTRLNALGERVPWMLEVSFKKTGSGDTGTLTLKCGSKSQAFTLSSYANTTWNTVRLDLDKDLFYRNWREDAPDIEIEWASTSAVLYLDDAKFAPMPQIGGLWWWLSGGETAFLQRDVFTHATTGGAWADAELMNSARWAGVPINLPTDNTGSETIGDP